MYRLVAAALGCILMLPPSAGAQESIADYTEAFEQRDGYFPVYWDATEGRLLLEIPRIGEEFLYLTSLATGLGSTQLGLDRGFTKPQAHRS